MQRGGALSAVLGTLCCGPDIGVGAATLETGDMLGTFEDVEAIELLEAIIKNFVDPGQI